MAQSLVSRIGDSPLWRAGLASAFILGLAGFAAGVIPQACRNSFVICQAEALAPLEIEPAEAAPAETPQAATPAPQLTAMAEPAATAPLETTLVNRDPASITQNDLIAQTFDALDIGLNTAAGELTARKVRTVEIGPDGMPVVTGGATETQVADASSAEPEPAPVQVAEAEVSAAAASSEERAAAEADEPTASAYAPVRGNAAVVGRQGANVRSLPQTRGSEVLFALASGSDVTIVETQKGWAKVVDDRGRSGWIWDDLLNR